MEEKRGSLRRLVVVRHGETVGDSSTRYHGINDVVLSSAGRSQARLARSILGGEEFAHVISSPLARAWQSAGILAPDREPEIEEGLREVDFGRWEGLSRREIAERDPEIFAAWQRGGGAFDYPEGERRADFRLRIGEALARVLERHGPSALVVAHKGVIRVLVEGLTGEILSAGQPELGAVLSFRVDRAGHWVREEIPPPH